MLPAPPHPSLLKFCTPRQAEILQAWIDTGSSYAAAEKLRMKNQGNVVRAKSEVIKKAKREGWNEEDFIVHVPEEITIVEEHALKKQVSTLKSQIKELAEENSELTNTVNLLAGYQGKQLPELKVSKKHKSKPVVAATAFLSDTHFDEVVRPEQIGWINEYNREIAVKRLERFAEKTMMVSRDLMSGFEIRRLDLIFGGDIVSGEIHEEIRRTNDAEIMDTVYFWSDRLAEIVVTLAKEFEQVFIPCVVGNHGRNSLKPRHKGRVRSNFDWLIYCNCMRSVKASGCNNVGFDISESTDVLWETMGWTYLLTHGDQAQGGGGWGGIFSPIMRLYEKKLKAYAGRGLNFDYLVMGHWHQLVDAGPVLVNGSLKGYDEFAHNMNFRPEPAQQAFWLTDPEHGKIFSGPLFVEQ